MKLTPNKDNTYTLHLTESSAITLEASWVDYLRLVSFDGYGDYIRSTIYPGLSDTDKRTWNRVTVSNREFHEAVDNSAPEGSS